MSCNDYTIELIATQLVTPENNTANHSPQIFLGMNNLSHLTQHHPTIKHQKREREETKKKRRLLK
jgi:hypothetical protein